MTAPAEGPAEGPAQGWVAEAIYDRAFVPCGKIEHGSTLGRECMVIVGRKCWVSDRAQPQGLAARTGFSQSRAEPVPPHLRNAASVLICS